MDKKKLNQYRVLQKEIPLIEKKLDKLYKSRASIPEISGKVQSSQKEFPYIESHVTVQMYEPKESDRINRQIRINEARLKAAEADKAEIDSFIAGLSDSSDRLIIEMVYMQGKKFEDVGKMLGYTKGRISQKIKDILKD